jgi:hypothetical protein
VPDISNAESTEVVVSPSTTYAKLNIPATIFDSKVGKIMRIWILVEQINVSFDNLEFSKNPFHLPHKS